MILKTSRRNRRRNLRNTPRSSRLPMILGMTALILFATVSASANVSLPALLADHMVVQRGLPVRVWGMAAPHESVAVTFRGETKSATADDLGRWSVSLSPGEAPPKRRSKANPSSSPTQRRPLPFPFVTDGLRAPSAISSIVKVFRLLPFEHQNKVLGMRCAETEWRIRLRFW